MPAAKHTRRGRGGHGGLTVHVLLLLLHVTAIKECANVVDLRGSRRERRGKNGTASFQCASLRKIAC